MRCQIPYRQQQTIFNSWARADNVSKRLYSARANFWLNPDRHQKKDLVEREHHACLAADLPFHA